MLSERVYCSCQRELVTWMFLRRVIEKNLAKTVLEEERFSHVPDFYLYLYKVRVHRIFFLKIILNSQRRLITLQPFAVDFPSINTLSNLPIESRKNSGYRCIIFTVDYEQVLANRKILSTGEISSKSIIKAPGQFCLLVPENRHMNFHCSHDNCWL